MDKIEAPFTKEQIHALIVYQASAAFHPYTCPNRGDGEHLMEQHEGMLYPTRNGLICAFCGYLQTWAFHIPSEQVEKIERAMIDMFGPENYP